MSKWNHQATYIAFRRLEAKDGKPQATAAPVEPKARKSKVMQARKTEQVLGGVAASMVVEPNAEAIRSTMLQMVFLIKTTKDANIRTEAMNVYDQCWHMLRVVDLGIAQDSPTEEVQQPRADQ